MFAVIRHYHFNPKDGAEIDRRIHEDFVPIVKKAKGFVRYYWLDTGKGEGASVSVFEDKAGADESVRLAADYVQEHLSKFIIQKHEMIGGVRQLYRVSGVGIEAAEEGSLHGEEQDANADDGSAEKDYACITRPSFTIVLVFRLLLVPECHPHQVLAPLGC